MEAFEIVKELFVKELGLFASLLIVWSPQLPKMVVAELHFNAYFHIFISYFNIETLEDQK